MNLTPFLNKVCILHIQILQTIFYEQNNTAHSAYEYFHTNYTVHKGYWNCQLKRKVSLRTVSHVTFIWGVLYTVQLTWFGVRRWGMCTPLISDCGQRCEVTAWGG